jgi:predicted CXXCH cytochrome family protein
MTSVLLALVLAQAGATGETIRNTRHNLSAGGPATNTVRSSQDEVCVFCHTPHKAHQSQPIWNRDLSYQSGAGYQMYSSTTFDPPPAAAPNGAAKLCLSCHDGMLAIGSVLNLNAGPGNIPMSGTTPDGKMPAGRTLLGTDLRNDHPVSFVPDVQHDPEIRLPSPDDPIQLQVGATPGVKDSVQCTSCHEPHLETYKFLRKDNAGAAVCLTCHDKPGWSESIHSRSRAPYPANDPLLTVSDTGCMNCHTPHNATSPQRLHTTANKSKAAAFEWKEENVCYQCHQPGGTGTDAARARAAPDIMTQMQKVVHHPVELRTAGAGPSHEPVFTDKNPAPEGVLNTTVKHVECADCHNPHQVNPLPAIPTSMPVDATEIGEAQRNVHTGMKGIAKNGSIVVDSPARPLQQWEICFRCHGDSFELTIPPAATRPPSGSNKRREFDPTSSAPANPGANMAFHPVGTPGRNRSPFLRNVADGGQLRGNAWDGTPLNFEKTLLCTDCHNNEQTADTPGSARGSPSGPKGPHGGANPRMLRANYSFAVGTASGAPFGGYNRNNHALCFICHDEASLFGNRTNFDQGNLGAGRGNLHQMHLQDRTNANCHECHNNIHSNVDAQNTIYSNMTGQPTHLVNFAPNVRPFGGTSGRDPHTGQTVTKPVWGRTPSGDMYCFVGCHGRNDKMDGQKSIYRPPQPGP